MTRSTQHICRALGAVAVLALQACGDDRAPTELVPGSAAPTTSEAPPGEDGRYIVVFAAERVPADFGERVARLGGSVEATLDVIGVAAVTELTEAAAAELAAAKDVRAVEPEALKSTSDDDGGSDEVSAEEAVPEAPAAPADATASPPTKAQFWLRQWNMRAIFADKAWAAGHLGSRDVVVAILDTGIDYLHPDLDGLVDLSRSKSFAAANADDPTIQRRFSGRLPISDLRGHGTGMAAIVGSNAVHFAGVNRDVTLLAVKIWNRLGVGPLSQLLSGIVYAADQGADVINVSGSYNIDKSQTPGTVAAVERAANYAFRKGALLIGIAGNDAVDLDHNGDMVRLPCEAANALCASATGPTAADSVNGPWTDVDARADGVNGKPYSAFGRSAIHVAAPGGAAAQFRRVWLPCPTTQTEFAFAPACRPGFVLPPFMPFPLSQCQGTSCSAAHVTGLAALLVAQMGKGNPALIRSRILQSADDLGEPGTDPYYGKGRINIARALGVVD